MMTRDEVYATLKQAIEYGRSTVPVRLAYDQLVAHDAEQRAEIAQLRNEVALLKQDDAERCTLIRDMEEGERRKDEEIEEQRQEIARLRAALVEIVKKCEYEDWEYMFGDILIQAKQALKETTT